jgi:hypothetical protein
MTGFNLPPGCNVSDIPGNRPEDEAWEKITDEFWSGKYCSDDIWNKFEQANLDSYLVEIVDKAIEYGIEVGGKEQTAEYEMQRDCVKHRLKEIIELEVDAICQSLLSHPMNLITIKKIGMKSILGAIQEKEGK